MTEAERAALIAELKIKLAGKERKLPDKSDVFEFGAFVFESAILRAEWEAEDTSAWGFNPVFERFTANDSDAVINKSAGLFGKYSDGAMVEIRNEIARVGYVELLVDL